MQISTSVVVVQFIVFLLLDKWRSTTNGTGSTAGLSAAWRAKPRKTETLAGQESRGLELGGGGRGGNAGPPGPLAIPRQPQSSPPPDRVGLTWPLLRPISRPMQPIVPIRRKEPFDGDGWLFELKLDGFRGLADTIRGRMLSKNGNRLKRFKPLLGALPAGFVFDGEIVALDGDGRPKFNDLLFGRREPVYVAFDVLVVDGEDVRALALKERKALLEDRK